VSVELRSLSGLAASSTLDQNATKRFAYFN